MCRADLPVYTPIFGLILQNGSGTLSTLFSVMSPYEQKVLGVPSFGRGLPFHSGMFLLVVFRDEQERQCSQKAVLSFVFLKICGIGIGNLSKFFLVTRANPLTIVYMLPIIIHG